MKRYLAALLLGAGMIAAQSPRAQDMIDMQALRKAVQSDKKAFVESTLKLSSAEARKFWPLYAAYQRDVDMANRRRVVAVEALISLDRPLSDLYARNLATELIAADEIEVKSRRALQNRLMRALPAKKAARYLQLESKIRALQAYDIAASLPLIN